MRRKISVVYETDEYGIFKRMIGNRTVTESRVKKVIDSIKKVGYIKSPIIVNDNYEVIDGQARLEALKRLNIPVCYVVIEGIGNDECVAMNTYSTIWSIRDYIAEYSERGFISYKYLEQLIKQYCSWASIPTINRAITGSYSLNNKAIKDGSFECGEEDYNNAVLTLEYVKRFDRFIVNTSGRREYYHMALAFCFECIEINNDRMFEKVYCRQMDLIPVSNVEQALGVLEEIYNNRAREKVYIVTEYKKKLNEKYVWYSKKYRKETE